MPAAGAAKVRVSPGVELRPGELAQVARMARLAECSRGEVLGLALDLLDEMAPGALRERAATRRRRRERERESAAAWE